MIKQKPFSEMTDEEKEEHLRSQIRNHNLGDGCYAPCARNLYHYPFRTPDWRREMDYREGLLPYDIAQFFIGILRWMREDV